MPARKGSQKEDRWRITEMNSISDADLAQTPRQTPMKWALLAIVLLALSNVGLAVAAGIAWGSQEPAANTPRSSRSFGSGSRVEI